MTSIIRDPFVNTKDQEAEKEALLKAKKERAESSDYVNIKVGESRLLRFLPARGIKIVDKTYQGRPTGTKTNEFTVVDLETSNLKEKTFQVGWNSRKLIEAALNAGHRMLKITRTGEGNETLYTPTPV
jgi:hypothetical protein